MKKQVNQDNTIKFGQFMTMGEQSMTQGGIHIEYNEALGAAKYGLGEDNKEDLHQSQTGIRQNFVKKSKDNTVSCLNLQPQETWIAVLTLRQKWQDSCV